jgi:hypothetical protein
MLVSVVFEFNSGSSGNFGWFELSVYCCKYAQSPQPTNSKSISHGLEEHVYYCFFIFTLSTRSLHPFLYFIFIFIFFLNFKKFSQNFNLFSIQSLLLPIVSNTLLNMQKAHFYSVNQVIRGQIFECWTKLNTLKIFQQVMTVVINGQRCL